MTRRKLLRAALAAALLAGCSTWGNQPTAPDTTGWVHLSLIRTMMGEGNHLAALAHLDALPEPVRSAAEARYLRAEARRRMGDLDAAREIYLELLDGEWGALAHRGLGQLEVECDRLDLAIRHFERARELRPSDGRVRNDLGYALILAGRFEDARRELATAVELGANDGRSGGNLVLALLAAGREREALQLADREGIDSDAILTLDRLARSIRSSRVGDRGEELR